MHQISYAQAKKSGNNNNQNSNPLFKKVTNTGIEYVQAENGFDDFEKEILLPHKQSENGPYLATADVDGDGRSDVFVGGAAGMPGQLFLQKTPGQFKPSPQVAFTADQASEDLGCLFFDADGDGDADLYVVSGGNEFAPGAKEYLDRLYLNDGKGQFSKAANALPKIYESGQNRSEWRL